MKTTLFCCGCNKEVQARLTNGREIYPKINNLFTFHFWKCDTCGNYVGCQYKTKDCTKPLGCIPTPELREARRRIHMLLDPIWKSGKMSRGKLYRVISKEIGYEYHTAELRTIEESNLVLNILLNLDQ